MIARTWHGAVPAEKADDYLDYLLRTGVPDLKSTPGNLGVYVLRRSGDATAHFVMISLWESREAIRAFAGDDIERARYYPEDGAEARALAQKWGGRTVDKAKDLFGIGPGVEELLSVKLADLGDYYARPEIRAAIRDRLAAVLRENRGRRVLLIAHSMGSIIAHDVLRAAEGSADQQIEHWLTIGSPLGLPLVSRKMREEFGEQRTPTSVDRWSNLSDPGDKVALDCNLRDEFPPNTGGVRVEDVFLHNDYVNPVGEANHHKSYGYLRAPELSDLVRPFLASQPPRRREANR